MGLFGKKEIRKVMLPYYFVEIDEEIDSGIIDIEVRGMIDGKMQYCVICFSLKDLSLYDDDDKLNELLEVLKSKEGTPIEVELIYKNDRFKKVRVNGDFISKAINDPRFEGDILCWGLNDESVLDQY